MAILPIIEGGGGEDPRVRVSATMLMQLVAWIVGLVLVYGAVNTRVALIEQRQQDNDSRLRRIEEKLDRALETRR